MSLRRFFRRARWDRERHEELESYLQIETDENIARGMPTRLVRLHIGNWGTPLEFERRFIR